MKQSISSFAAAAILLTACADRPAGDETSSLARDPASSPEDAAFAGVQQRGERAMGVDQYAALHQFDILPDGGRVELQWPEPDATQVATIRAHLQEIVVAFRAGDFTTPAFVHAQQVPGTDVMAAKRDAIRYEFRELPRGGEVRMTTGDAEALEAIRRFVHFQRSDHRAGGHDHH